MGFQTEQRVAAALLAEQAPGAPLPQGENFRDQEQAEAKARAEASERLRLEEYRHAKRMAQEYPRFVDAKSGRQAPQDGERVVNPHLLERWTPVYAPVDSEDVTAIAVAVSARKPAGWNVSYHLRTPYCDCHNPRFELRGRVEILGVVHYRNDLVHAACGRPALNRVEGDFADHVRSLQLAPEDDATYNAFYPTLPGNDVAHADFGKRGLGQYQGGDVIRASDGAPIAQGREIRGGRAEWRQATKDMVLVDRGYTAHVDRLKAEKDAKRKAERALLYEAVDKSLPRKLGEL